MGRRLPGSSVHGILQAGVLEWIAMPSSRESSWTRDQIFISNISCISRQVLYHKHNLRRPRFPYYRSSNIHPNSLKWARIQFISWAMTADLGQSLALSSQSTQTQSCIPCSEAIFVLVELGKKKKKKTWLLLYYQKRKTLALKAGNSPSQRGTWSSGWGWISIGASSREVNAWRLSFAFLTKRPGKSLWS